MTRLLQSALLALSLLPAVALAGDGFWQTPTIAGAGKIHPMPQAAYQPDRQATYKADVYTAGRSAIAEKQKQHDWFAESYDYARNPLAILVARGNPKHIEGLKDLGRADVRVSMPNPAWEGIAKQIEAS